MAATIICGGILTARGMLTATAAGEMVKMMFREEREEVDGVDGDNDDNDEGCNVD